MNNKGNELIKRSYKLSKDFGGKYENVDDHEHFSYIAKQYKLNTKNYDKALQDYNNFRKKNIKVIKKTEKIIKKLDRTKLDNYNKNLQNHSNKLTNNEKNRLEELQKKVNKIKTEEAYSKFENSKEGQEYRYLVIKEIKGG